MLSLGKGYLEPWLGHLSSTLPYLTLGIGFLLGLRFHRSRLAFAVLLLILSDRTLYYFGPGGQAATGFEIEIINIVAVLLPLNLGILCLVKERGLLNIYGFLHLCFIAVQPLLFYNLLHSSYSYLLDLGLNIIPFSLPYMGDVPQLVLLAYTTVLLFFLFLSLTRKDPGIRGLFWALLSCGVSLYELFNGKANFFFFSIAGVIIILALLETVYSMAYHDDLTGLPARRSLNTFMQGLGRNYTVAMLDIDFFKKFNDRYGHDVGDQVLCMVAAHINRVSGGGKPFRYGGEEFTIIFPGKSRAEARPFLEKLRKSIAESRFKIRGKNRPKKIPKTKRKVNNPKTVSVTISIGAAAPINGFANPAEVIKEADKALYQAKKKGRNCTVC